MHMQLHFNIWGNSSCTGKIGHKCRNLQLDKHMRLTDNAKSNLRDLFPGKSWTISTLLVSLLTAQLFMTVNCIIMHNRLSMPSRLLLWTFKNATLILKAHITHDYFYMDGLCAACFEYDIQKCILQNMKITMQNLSRWWDLPSRATNL